MAHEWIEGVIICFLRFNFVETNVIRRHFRNDSISVDPLQCYMYGLTALIECKILLILPERLAIDFDG